MTTKQDYDLNSLRLAVSSHDDGAMRRSLDEAILAGNSFAAIRGAITQGIEDVRHRLMSNDTSIPDFLLSIDTVTEGLNTLVERMHLDNDYGEKDISLVIGVVEGDPHDIGKNIIAAVYRAAGFRVIDLGLGVSKEDFIASVLKNNAKVLAVSAMMSTTAYPAMRDIVLGVKMKAPKTVVMLGGASLDERLAITYGADGYAATAITVIEETEKALKHAGHNEKS